MADFQCRLSAQGFSIETFLLSNATRPQSRRRGTISSIKLLCGTFSPWGRATRDTRTQFCSKGPNMSHATKSPFNGSTPLLSLIDLRRIVQMVVKSKRFPFLGSGAVTLCCSSRRKVCFYRQADWRSGAEISTTIWWVTEPMYEDMPEKIRKLESSRVRLGQRYVPSRIYSVFHFKRSAPDRSSAFPGSLLNLTFDVVPSPDGTVLSSSYI